MSRLYGNLPIATRCKQCGRVRLTRLQAEACCRRQGAIGRRPTPQACHVCGEPCESARAAYVHCQQRGAQRDGYQWRLYESLDRAYERRIAEVRADPAAMGEIRLLAEALAAMMPEWT